ncbi:unnamed protein product, partial [Timema podura]|nr:unnamed protein product [Timema podura]
KCCSEQLNTTQLSDDQQDWTHEKSAPDTQSSETVEKEAETGANDDPEAAQHTEEEPKELTLDEYKALRGNRQKPTFNLRKAGEGEDLSQWKKMYALNKKKEGEEEEDEEDVRYLVLANVLVVLSSTIEDEEIKVRISVGTELSGFGDTLLGYDSLLIRNIGLPTLVHWEYDASDYPQRVGRQKHLLDIDIHFADTRRGTRSRGRGGPRAGGGGGSRGGGVGPTRGNITPGLRGAISGGETRQTNICSFSYKIVKGASCLSPAVMLNPPVRTYKITSALEVLLDKKQLSSVQADVKRDYLDFVSKQEVRDRDRMDRPEREPYQNRATRQSAPKVDDEHDFPSLG